jgi:hypothetical protein
MRRRGGDECIRDLRKQVSANLRHDSLDEVGISDSRSLVLDLPPPVCFAHFLTPSPQPTTDPLTALTGPSSPHAPLINAPPSALE